MRRFDMGRLGDIQFREMVSVATAMAMFAGLLIRVREEWFYLPGAIPYAEQVARSTLDGNAIAPNQYRFLMPWIDQGAAWLLGVSLPSGQMLTDAFIAAVVLVLLYRLASLLATPELTVAAAAAVTYWAMRMNHWNPEVMLLMLLVTVAALAVVADRFRWWVPLLIGIVACGARTDYSAALGLVTICVGFRNRDWRLASSGAVLIAIAVAATRLLVAVYPNAHYITDVVQFPYNFFTANSWAVVVLTYGPLLLTPLLVTLRLRILPTLWPIHLWFLIQFACTYIVGRVDETRIFLPFAPALGIAAVVAYTQCQGRVVSSKREAASANTSDREVGARPSDDSTQKPSPPRS